MDILDDIPVIPNPSTTLAPICEPEESGMYKIHASVYDLEFDDLSEFNVDEECTLGACG